MDRSSLVDGFQLMKDGFNVPLQHMLRLLRSSLIREMVDEAKSFMLPGASGQDVSDDDEFLMGAVLEHEQFQSEREHQAAKKSAAASGPAATSTPVSNSYAPARKSLSLSTASSPRSAKGSPAAEKSPKSDSSVAGGKKAAAAKRQPAQAAATPTTFPIPSMPASALSRGSLNSSSSSSSSPPTSSKRGGGVGSRAGGAPKRAKVAAAASSQSKPSLVGVSRAANPLLRRSIPVLTLENDGPGEECSDFDE